MSISALRFSSPLLHLPLASARLLLRHDRHRLPLSTLRLLSTSPSPTPKSSPLAVARRKDDTVSTEPPTAYGGLVRRVAPISRKKRTDAPPPPQPPPPPPNEFVSGEGIEESTCMEVFDLRIQRFDVGTNSTRIYGTLRDSLFQYFFYNRPRTDPESLSPRPCPLHPRPCPLLTGPERPFYADKPFVMDIEIKDADTDRLIINGCYAWNSHGFGQDYDRFIEEKIRVTNASAVLSYAVFKRAVSATVQITLNHDWWGFNRHSGTLDNDNVHGVVSASNTSMSEGRSVLFRREREHGVNVKRRGLLPLSRCVVALPTDSDLNVHVELWKNDEFIANATATFQHHSGRKGRTSIMVINKQVVVEVTWTGVGGRQL